MLRTLTASAFLIGLVAGTGAFAQSHFAQDHRAQSHQPLLAQMDRDHDRNFRGRDPDRGREDQARAREERHRRDMNRDRDDRMRRDSDDHGFFRR